MFQTWPTAQNEGGGHSRLDGDQEELYSECLKLQQKVFFFDAKRNQRGSYLKLSEKGRYRPKSSIVLPLQSLLQFTSLFDFYLQEAANGRLGHARDMVVEGKVFSFSMGDNDRGRFLRIYESGGGYPSGGSSLMIPSGWQNEALHTFRTSLQKLIQFLQADGTFDLSPASFAAALPVTSVSPDSVLLDCTKEGGPVLSVGSKHFFFEMRRNARGQYVNIKEVSGNIKNLLVVPIAAVPKFQEALSLALLSHPQLADHTGPGASH